MSLRYIPFLLSLITACTVSLSAQKKKTVTPPEVWPAATPAAARLESHRQRLQLGSSSAVQGVPFRSIGPTVMSGRVTDMDVNPDDPTQFYVAYASGGVFVTRNNGQSFSPVFDGQSSLTIGDIAVDWKHGEIIWVGTGESNSSRSSYAGTGIFKSADKGRTWVHIGLPESHHIGKIELHPADPQTAWVAAAGHLYSDHPERGVFKTTDGGHTWRKVLYTDARTGAIDLALDLADPDIVYAVLWERERKPWQFKGSGENSGIYKSTDGGSTWRRISGGASGFPEGRGVGRIGLAVYPGDSNTIYAFLDNQNTRTDLPPDTTARLTRQRLRAMSRDSFLQLDDKIIQRYLEDNNFPERHKAADIRDSVRTGRIQPSALVDYVEDANRLLFDTPIIGAELYRSDDGGRTWRKTHTDHLEGLYYTYGYYFGKMNVAPHDRDQVYLYGVDIVHSSDGGHSFSSILADNVHVDFHGMWINPRKPDHLILATDGGLNMSYDNGKTWSKLNAPAVSQFYAINVDNARPYNVYGGMQDNGVWYGPSNYTTGNGWHQSGQYPYRELGGGDGMQIAIDTSAGYVYYGYQFGHYFRKHTESGDIRYITPRHELGSRPYRWNWQTPILVSRHNPSILYMGSNHFHRSMDKGESFTLCSRDLTGGGKPGDVPYGTLTTLDESPLSFGLLYTGSDDGKVHISRDAGKTWEDISAGLPARFWVSRVIASRHRESRVYVTLNGYRYDHFDPYLYVSEDYGRTWTRLGSNLPLDPVNVVREDPVRPEILYLGTDGGLFMSLDRGLSFAPFGKDLPNVAVHDLVIQEREKELIAGTHGRSLYVASLRDIQSLTPEVLQSALHVFQAEPVSYNPNWGRKRQVWSTPAAAEIRIPLWSGAVGTLQAEVMAGDIVLKTWPSGEVVYGLQYLSYDGTIDSAQLTRYLEWLRQENPQDSAEISRIAASGDGQYYIRPGKYTVRLRNSAGQEVRAGLEIQKGRRGFRWGIRPSQREERKIKEIHWD